MQCVGQRASDGADSALFEEVLWQPNADDAENEMDDANAAPSAADKAEGLFQLYVVV